MTRLKQKLYEAVHALVGDGELDTRLTFAAMSLAQLLESDIPDQFRNDVAALRHRLEQTPLSSAHGYTARQISDEEAREVARRIFDLFTEVMGGL